MRRTRALVVRLCLLLLLASLVSCDTVGGASQDNLPPESEIVEPVQASGTLTIADADSIVFRWRSVDPEEQAGDPGGISAIEIQLDGETPILFGCPPDSGEWWFSSSEDSGSAHYISSENPLTGGNCAHLFAVRAQDVMGCWESQLVAARYVFSYNHPPSSEVLSPQAGEVVATTFTVTWRGIDVDGEVSVYQYVLDPQSNTYDTTADTSVSYSGVATGEHEFRLRAKDNAGCWEETYQIIRFDVE